LDKRKTEFNPDASKRTERDIICLLESQKQFMKILRETT